jgi:hypothetical protein
MAGHSGGVERHNQKHIRGVNIFIFSDRFWQSIHPHCRQTDPRHSNPAPERAAPFPPPSCVLMCVDDGFCIVLEVCSDQPRSPLSSFPGARLTGELGYGMGERAHPSGGGRGAAGVDAAHVGPTSGVRCIAACGGPVRGVRVTVGCERRGADMPRVGARARWGRGGCAGVESRGCGRRREGGHFTVP